uniref:MIT_C domain-containing protein n=1 Tax=Caenorhabditis tropicalis TaxID=1561998 RepID=A0A1I7T3A7_9PELO
MSADEKSLLKKAGPILCDAVNDEKAGKLSRALVRYKQGIELIAQAMRKMPIGSEDRNKIMKNFAIYVRKVADLEYRNKTSAEVDQLRITANSIGHSYKEVFTRCCDAQLRMVHVQDAYIVAHHQLVNFVRFCELIVSLSANLLVITLLTGEDARKNQAEFAELTRSLEKRGVTLLVDFSSTIHDREIIFDNGWVVKSGRGLDYFRPPEGKYILGAYDMAQRPCHETTIDFLKRKS